MIVTVVVPPLDSQSFEKTSHAFSFPDSPVLEGYEEGNIATWLQSYDSLRLRGSQALGELGTAPGTRTLVRILRCSQTCPNNFRAQVCNVRSITTTMSMLERWAWYRRSGESRQCLSGGPVSSCRSRFSANFFIVSFGGKRSVKGNEEDRSWHREKPMLSVGLAGARDKHFLRDAP
jgi:hypothetical protein